MVRAQARALGFTQVGLAPAGPAPHLDAFLRWVAAGRHGEMHYLARPDRLARRQDLNVILPGVKTVIAVGVGYTPPDGTEAKGAARMATYAWGQDYHAALLRRLEDLAAWLQRQGDGSIRCRAYVDTGALLEREQAQQAGLGFIGKNTMLIDPRRGSDFFLGEILTDLEVDAYDQPQRAGQCGSCARCLKACPTQAFPQPYVLDARRCISYLTIEYAGWIDPDLRPRMGPWVFGCDICRAVCPWQKFTSPATWPEFRPGPRPQPTLDWLLELEQTTFENAFRETALRRIGRDRLVRNACVAAGNSQDPALLPRLKRRLDDASALVRGHAAWAVARLGGRAAVPWLEERLGTEPAEAVRRELRAGLDEAGIAN